MNKLLYSFFILFCSIEIQAAVSFEKAQISLGRATLRVELAKSPEQLARGLMFRQKLADNEGMLFIYEQETILHFWMKNTFIPLSIGFFDRKQKLIDIQEMLPVKSEMQMIIPNYKSAAPAKYALEVPSGWFKKNNVKLGTPFHFISKK